MKRLLIKFAVILFYLFLLMAAAGFQIHLLFDGKSILLILLGTFLLSIANNNGIITWKKLKKLIPWNAQMTGYLTSAVYLFMVMSNVDQGRTVQSHVQMQQMVLCFRPLLYALILQILIREDSDDEFMKPESNAVSKEHYNFEKTMIDQNSFDPLVPKLSAMGFTPREIEVARCLCMLQSNADIAEELVLSETTVKKHISNIYKKVPVENREQFRLFVKSLMEQKKT